MKKLFAFTILIGLFSLFSIAQEVRYNDSWSKQGFSLVNSEQSGLDLKYSVNSFAYVDVDVNGEIMQAIIMPGVFLPNDAGAPNLPGESRFVAIPQGATAKLNIKGMRTETYSNVNVAPAPVIPLDTDNSPLHYEKNMGIFGVNAPYPANPVVLSEPMKLRGVDVVMLAITPFQYNPVTRELTVVRDLDLEVVFEGGNGEFGDTRYRSRWWDPILGQELINYQALPAVDYSARYGNVTEDEEYEYIIITPDDATFVQWANTIKDFRDKQGIYTGVVTISEVGGNTVNAIESYVNNAYNNWSNAPAAILLLGDYTQITSHMYSHPAGYPAFASDNKYADVNNDELPDIAFARITANNATELETMITKFIDYETNPPTDPDFYNHPITALGWQTERWFQICSEVVGGYFKNELGKDPVRINEIYSGSPGSTWSTATNTSTVVNYFGPNGLGYIPASPSTLGGWSGGNANDVINAINGGSFLLQHRDHGEYTGWGEPYFQTYHINSLTNTDNKLTFVFSINCQTGAFHRPQESFTEKFHRHTHNGQNSGALGLLAATEVSYSFVNDTYVWGVMDNMYPDFMPNETTEFPVNYEMPAFGNAAGKHFLFQSSWPYNTQDKTITYRLFHHHGDAFLTLYSEVPQAQEVVHNGYIPIGASTYEVSVPNGAFACLYLDGEILGTGIGNVTFGPIVFNIPSNLPAGTEVTLTSTKQNFFRYEEQITVVDMISAGFQADTTQVCADGAINYTDLSAGGPTSWLWTFEGGTPETSTEQNPQGITYADYGKYDVSLEVSNGTSTDVFTMEDYITVMEKMEVSAVITPSIDMICEGEEVSFTVEPVNAGDAPVYQWKLNGEDVGDGTETYVTSALAEGDVVSCEVTSSLDCTVQNPVMSNDASVTVNEILVAGVSISTEASFICEGDEVIFTAIPENGGEEPAYQWMINGEPVGENSPELMVTDLADGDVVSCELTSNADCISGNPAASNTLEMSVNLYPVALETPQGPDQLDVYETPSSTYTTAEEPNTMEYHWSVSPENAWEELSNDMNSLTVTWATDFKGQATINVYGTNDCGDGDVSGNFEVSVQNTFGIVENNLGIGISVFPNPNNGNFTVKLSSDNNSTIKMQIRNVVGESVYSEENISVNGEFVKTIDFSKYAEGIYFLVIENGNKIATEKIIVQR